MSKNVGDITSSAPGSGARYNAGKARLEYIPARILADWVQHEYGNGEAAQVLALLATFEETRDGQALLDILARATPEDTSAVFHYGAQKYAPWNWAKGMNWSIPDACIKRHAVKIAAGEHIDPESGLPHMGHIGCNAVMLLHYMDFWPSGDDLAPIIDYSFLHDDDTPYGAEENSCDAI